MSHNRMLIAMIVGLVLIVAACTDEGDASSTSSGEVATTSSATETTMSESPSTSSTEATKTSEGQAFAVELAHSALIVGGVEYFVGQNGSDPEPVIGAVTAVLGEPTTDSGWGLSPIGDGEVRFVQWDNGFTLTFDDSEVPGEGRIRHFAFYVYPGFPSGIFTVMEGITVGSSVGEVIAAVEQYRPEVGLDQYRWVQSALAGNWVIEAGNPEFGFLCFNTGMATEPSDDAQIVTIFAGEDCTFDGE